MADDHACVAIRMAIAIGSAYLGPSAEDDVAGTSEQPDTADSGYLSVPGVPSAHYGTNFIRLAVCELRFPTLFEIDDRPPTSFAKAVRKEYPTYEQAKNVNLNSGVQATVHSFKSKDHHWSTSIRSSAISLETRQYSSFAEFQTRLRRTIAASAEAIDSDFFTRVGLRYINVVPYDVETIQNWVRPDLVSALSSGTYGHVTEHWQRVQGVSRVGGYTFQHGIGVVGGTQQDEYVLDFDFFKEDVVIEEVPDVVAALHEQLFSMFMWSLGDHAKQKLEQAAPSRR